jgi:hypothetical protein
MLDFCKSIILYVSGFALSSRTGGARTRSLRYKPYLPGLSEYSTSIAYRRQPLSEPWPRHQRFTPGSNRDHPEALSAGGVTKRAIAGS